MWRCRLYTVCTHCVQRTWAGGADFLADSQPPFPSLIPFPTGQTFFLYSFSTTLTASEGNCNPSPSRNFNWKTARLQAFHCPGPVSPPSLSRPAGSQGRVHVHVLFLWLLFNMTQQKQQLRPVNIFWSCCLRRPLSPFHLLFAAGYSRRDSHSPWLAVCVGIVGYSVPPLDLFRSRQRNGTIFMAHFYGRLRLWVAKPRQGVIISPGREGSCHKPIKHTFID